MAALKRAYFVALAMATCLPSAQVVAQSAPEHHAWQDKRSFEPFSRTSDSITGAIKLSGNAKFATVGSQMTLTFGNGKKVKLTSVGASWRRWSDSEDKLVTAEVFKMAADPGKLENGNTLCGGTARYVVFHDASSVGDTWLLGVAVFDSKKSPHDINSPGLCGTFNYVND
ncbi:hypothetical protein [Mesorhizobium sp. A623]